MEVIRSSERQLKILSLMCCMLVISVKMEAICSSETFGLHGVTSQKIVSTLQCYFASSEFEDRWMKKI
jgi:hypothetical protein